MTTPLPEDRHNAQVDATVAAVRQFMVDSATSKYPQETALVSRAPAGLAAAKSAGNDNRTVAPSPEMNVSASNWRSRIPGPSPTRKSFVIGGVILLVALNLQVVFWLLLFVIAAIIGSCLFWGSDALWHCVISGFRWLKQRHPPTARHLKVRGYLLTKRWDRVVGCLPAAFADGMKSPDLRAIAAADAQHDAALTARLSRLG